MKRLMITLLASMFLVGITAVCTSLSIADETKTTTETTIDSFDDLKQKSETETKTDAFSGEKETIEKRTETSTDSLGDMKHEKETQLKIESDGGITEKKTETKTTDY